MASLCTIFAMFSVNLNFFQSSLFKKRTQDNGVTQVVEHLSSKCETQSSNPSTTGKKKQQENTGAM
jgi:hypothetical protein